MDFKIGLELHVYLNTDVKLFCNCPVDFAAEPNTTICPVCTGQPGSKPMLVNEDAYTKALQVALLLGCKISPKLLLQRKHYSWPDLPNGYQKTMSGDFGLPVGVAGNFRGIGIQQCHLEEDPARWDPVTGSVDYNRSGYPLLEIVTDPDFTDLEKLREWLDELVLSLSYLEAILPGAGVKGDVNVSIGPKFERVEIKNINSFTAMVEAATFEIGRQQQEVAAGKAIPLQTRTWNDATSETLFMRSKEEAQDYRFIPEPDLPVISVDFGVVNELSSSMPMMPWEKQAHLVSLGVADNDAQVLTHDIGLVRLFDAVNNVDVQLAARWTRREVTRVANYHHKTVLDLGLDVEQYAVLLKLLHEGTITDNVAQKLIERLAEDSFDVARVVDAEGLASVGGAEELEAICREVIAEQPKAVEDVRAGNEKSIHFLVGQVMRKTKGAAKPDVVRLAFEKLLNGS